MNLAALEAALRERLGVPSTDALFTTAVCDDLLNSALHLIEIEADWPWLETSETIAPVNGTATYTPAASDYLRTVALQWGDYPPMKRLDIEELRAMGTPAGRPAYFAVYADVLTVRPVPTGTTPTMTHLYIKREPDLSGSASPLMPVSYHYALVDLAAYLGFRRSRRLDEAGAALAAYQLWLDKMLARQSRLSDDMGGGTVPPKPAAAK